MPFQKKQISVDGSPEITPAGDNGISTTTEKNVKKTDVAAEVKLKRELLEVEELAASQAKEIADLKAKLSQPPAPTEIPGMDLISELKGQIAQLSQQVNNRPGTPTGGLRFRIAESKDVQDDMITFTSRSVVYVVASYKDARGLEHLPPFKLIVFNYAASDIRKNGKEEEIVNFSQYSTNLKPEIEFLRAHPFYGVSFSENTNDMAKEDVAEIQFRIQAATQLSTAAPETIFERAEFYGIPNWRGKSAADLRPYVLAKMTEQFKKENQELQENIIRTGVLTRLGIKERTE